MPFYYYQCPKCASHQTVSIPIAQFDALADRQKCECGGKLQRESFTTDTVPYFAGRQKPGSGLRPRLRGLDSGPGGFMAGRVENNGCGSRAQVLRLKKNLAAEGKSLTGVFVPGLCRKGHQEDPFAVVHSREEMAQKAAQLGRCLEDRDGVIFEPTLKDEFYAKQEAPYRCSEDVVKDEVAQEVKQKFGGKATKKQRKETVEKFVHIHSGNG